MTYVKGTELTQSQQRSALLAKRLQQKQKTGLTALPTPLEAEWLAQTKFPVCADGSFDHRAKWKERK